MPRNDDDNDNDRRRFPPANTMPSKPGSSIA